MLSHKVVSLKVILLLLLQLLLLLLLLLLIEMTAVFKATELRVHTRPKSSQVERYLDASNQVVEMLPVHHVVERLLRASECV